MMPSDEDELKDLVNIALQTAKDYSPGQKEILIRSTFHGTTRIGGVHTRDPLGLHVTIASKNEAQIERGTHITSHGYVNEEDMTFQYAQHFQEKPDSSKRRKNKDVWPPWNDLELPPASRFR
ncbi:hypothetical protein N7539_006855 [Penicillium diatomitis]|uniref:Uncharacterized protein n=1 Tax=Penicillium diatomitis TaxID=2819901 RepID=A0A9W9X372_9EURO|nr:uncharacterized protein N7539_006855 [Penicillium diatomitis]KAJ5480961.1 hypothetical protein N7539_006855 [Penicillium diatomitis]